MLIADNILRKRLANVYFLWGKGKTTVASELHRRHGFFVYGTDEARDRHWPDADPLYQPHMCKDYEKEYGVSDFWQLPPAVIAERERHWLREFTPMVIMDLVALAARREVILCEGDIEIEAVIPIASHMVYLSNQSTTFDWFNRPDHQHMLDSVKNRADLTEAEKDAIIRNAYNSVGRSEARVPEWVAQYGVHPVIWNDDRTVDQTTADVERYFDF